MRKQSLIHQNPSQDDEAQIFAAELGDAPSIDLHGFDSINAIYAVETFLDAHFMQRSGVVKIIHGRGTFTLRNAILVFLRSSPHVAAFRSSTKPYESDAVLYAVLAKR